MPIEKTMQFDCNDLGQYHLLLTIEKPMRTISINSQAEIEAAMRYIGYVVRGAFHVSTTNVMVQRKIMHIMFASFPIALCHCSFDITSTLSLDTVFANVAGDENDKKTIMARRVCKDWFLSDEKIKKEFNNNKCPDSDVSLSLLKHEQCGG